MKLGLIIIIVHKLLTPIILACSVTLKLYESICDAEVFMTFQTVYLAYKLNGDYQEKMTWWLVLGWITTKADHPLPHCMAVKASTWGTSTKR